MIVLIIGLGFVSASETNNSVQTVDHNSIDEISIGDVDIHHDAGDHTDDSQYQISNSASADKTDEHEPGTTDIQTQKDNQETNTASPTHDNNSHATNTHDSNPDVLSDNAIKGSAVKAMNSTETSPNQTSTTINIIDDTPKETNTSAQKQNPLRPDIEKIQQIFPPKRIQKNGTR